MMKQLLAVDIEQVFGGNGTSSFLTGGSNGGKTLGDLISLILKFSFVIAGVLILVMFLIAGFQIVMGAGQNNPDSAKKGKQAATTAAIGFVIVFVAYWIVRLIEIITKVNFITGSGF